MNDIIDNTTQAWGLAGAAFLSGFIACFSHAGVPTLSLAPVDVLVHEFRTMYIIGKSTSPLIAITATLCNGYSAYRFKDDTALIAGVVSPFALYLAATICVPTIIPYTILYMEPKVNRKLLMLGGMVEKGAKASDLGVSKAEVQGLLIRWKGMNFVRAGLVGLGAVLAAVATFR
ncbi:Noranthrone monooxygenase [Pyrenophora seminiperda CCB06]|uniref:Noranthrone monooxygenase n=1 Tax=Pyrenophora seminiperda CCB06 TaxID=1302712 RepID=A0A3M7MHN8_9PLEO|nr:Noranthrone monooxygenase [Pyrenophora seminiperda CCB06]